MKEDFKDTSDRTVAEIKSDVEDKVDNIWQAEISLTASSSGGGGGGAAWMGGGGIRISAAF